MFDPRSEHQAAIVSPRAEDVVRASYATPLSSDERSEADQLARRLHGEFRTLLAMMPENERGASTLARIIDIDRATCQRIVATASSAEPSIAMLGHLPGVAGLRQFAEAMNKRNSERTEPSNVMRDQLAAVSAAVDRLETFIARVGGSQRKLKERLAAEPDLMDTHDGVVSPADDIALRESLFRSATAMVGRWCSTAIDVRIVRPMPGNPDHTEGARMRGQIGHVARVGAVPFEVGETASLRALGGNGPNVSTLEFEPIQGPTGNALFLPYCTRPLPRVLSRRIGPRVFHVLDTDAAEGKPSDIIMAYRSGPDSHPMRQDPPVGEMWWLTTFPARRMVFDVWLHEDLAQGCVPSLELHLWGPDISQHGASRWSTRFPGGPRIELLGKGLGRASTAAFSRHKEMTADLYKQLGWDPSSFVGFRCEVAYPVWRAGYCMGFDFSAGATQPTVPPAEQPHQ